jgi:transcription factor TFIIIB component B''
MLHVFEKRFCFLQNEDAFPRGVHWSVKPSILRACNNVNLVGNRRDDGIEATTSFPDDPRTQDSAIFGDYVTPETGADEGRVDMETLDIVQEEGTTSSYVQHTGKLQPKPRLLETVVEEPEPHYSAGDTGYFPMGTNESEFMANVESRNGFSTYEDLQEEELNIPEAPRETVGEMEAQNASGGWEQEEQGVSPCINNTVTGEEENCMGNTVEEQSKRESKTGKSKRATSRKRKKTSEEPNKSSEKTEQKKFKHSSRRQKRTLEKELLETPDHEIRSLPLRDMLRLVEYKEWMQKKEAKGAGVQPSQESNNMNGSGSQYHSQGFDEEDEFGDFGIESSEYQENNVVKPDSPVNYQTYMNKTSRTRWSKEDTELFYEGIQEFGSNLSMIQQLFPERTREQMKLKFKLEERRNPLKLNDALSSRSKHFTHFKNVIKKLQQEAAAAKEGEEEEEAGAEAETTDVPENEEPEKSEETERASDGVAAGVKESDGGDVENGVRSDGGDECDDDEDFWNSYKSDM